MLVQEKVQRLVQRRAASYYFRIVVPADLRAALGRGEIVRSLRTGARSAAIRRCYALAAAAYSGFAQLKRYRATMTDDQLKALADRYLWDRLDEAEASAASVLIEYADYPQEVELRTDQLVDWLESTQRALGTKNQRAHLYAIADKLLEDARLAITKDSPEYQRFCLRLLRAQTDAANAELALLRGEGPPLTRATTPRAATSAAPSMSLSEAVAAYCAYKKAQKDAWTERTADLHEATYSELVAVLGDQPVAEISKTTLLVYYEALSRVPLNATKRWPTMSIREVIEATASMTIPRLSARSINKRIVMVRSLFSWLALTDIIERDPSVVLKAVPEENGADVRLPFTDAEVVKLLQLCEKDAVEDAHRWVPKVLAYSGLRLDEAAQLQRSDVVERDGVWCFNVNADGGKKVKTATAKRLVPVHSALLRDLLAYREGRPEGNLWGLQRGRYNHSAYLGKWLGKRVRRITRDKRKVIHSLRHNVATQLKSHGIEEYVIEAMLGHTSRSMSTGRYGKEIPPKKLQAVVGRITYAT